MSKFFRNFAAKFFQVGLIEFQICVQRYKKIIKYANF